MANLDDVRRLIGAGDGLAVVSTSRADGTIQSSVVNAGVLPHPVTQEDVVGLVARGGSVKLDNLRRTPRATAVVRVGWNWAAVEGPVELCGPDDPLDGVDDEGLRILLRDVFIAAGGTHDDFETYDRVMREERRCAVLIRSDRVYGIPPR